MFLSNSITTIYKLLLIIVNIICQDNIYNQKGLIIMSLVTILTYIGTPMTLIIASIITAFRIIKYKKRKLILEDIRNDFGANKYKELNYFIEKNSIDKENILEIIKKDIIHKTEIQLSIFILAMCLLGLFISPFIAAIVTLGAYLASTIIKAVLKSALNNINSKTTLYNNLELELRIGNISSVKRTFRKQLK